MNKPDKDGYVIAPDSVLRGHHQNILKNLEPIVKAVNTHDELIKQLTKCANTLAHVIGVLPDDWKEAVRKTRIETRELLKQAEQK